MNPLATVENLKSLASARAAMKKATTPDEKLNALEKGLTEIVERIAPNMAQASKPKLTTAIATSMVEKIEKIKDDSEAEVAAIYADARHNYEGVNNDSVIRDAVDARRQQRTASDNANALLSSFDVDD